MAEGWRDSVVAYIQAEAQPADKFGHQPRLYALTQRIAESVVEPCDDDILFAATWMHDLGVFLGHRPADPKALAGWDHVPYTVARTKELLTAWDFPVEKLAGVEVAILTHQPKDDPELIEAVVLRDADILEQLGAIGALRTLVKVGRDTRYATYSDALPVLERAVVNLPDKIRTPFARELAAPRVAALKALIAAIHEEAGDLLY